MSGVFELLHPRIRELLASRGMSRPTPPQEDAIPVILEGYNTLLVAPTGSGKTEAAMMPVLDGLLRGSFPEGIKALYVTPLRALNRDLVTRISWWASQLDLKLAVRHGDTPKGERRRQARNPPDILLTTPETLQILMVADIMRRHLIGVRWVIVDELHELAEDKRGSQLSVLLERLSRLSGEHQRIGLSATVGSPEKLAEFLVGREGSYKLVISKPEKPYEIEVVYPGVIEEDDRSAGELGLHPSAVSRLRTLSRSVRDNSPVLVFTNTRSESEVLVNRLRLYDPEIKVEVHHSSLSLERRLDAEERLKSGELDAVVCTSSLELGIDIGVVNMVIQYGSPRQVTRLVQRVGRSGHSLDRISKGIVIAVDEDDALEAATIARRALVGQLEEPLIPDRPYDVLVQQLAGLLLEDRMVRLKDVLQLLRRSYTYGGATSMDIEKAAGFMSNLRPPIARYLPYEELLITPASTRRLMEYHFTTLTMIPEEPKHVVMKDDGIPVGFLDEEFMAGYVAVDTKFVLAGRAWIVKQVLDDRVIVEEAEDPTGAIPSWVGEEIPVPEEVASEVGRLRGRMAEAGDIDGAVRMLVDEYGFSPDDAARTSVHVLEQASRGLPVPSDVLITVERWGEHTVIHTHRGLKANRTLSRLLARRLSEELGIEIVAHQDPYRVYLKGPIPTDLTRSSLTSLPDVDIETEIKSAFEDSWMFMRRLVQAARKMGVVKEGVVLTSNDTRRLRDLLRGTLVYEEAWRTLFEEDLDVRAVHRFLRGIAEGKIRVEDMGQLEEPSPIARVGLERAAVRGEVVDKSRLRRLVLASARSRFKWSRRTLVCMECLDYIEPTTLISIKELYCPVCGSRRIAVLEEGEDDVRAMAEEVLEFGKPTKRFSGLYRKALRSASLVERYGYPAAVASLFKIPTSAAEKVLSRSVKGDLDQLLLELSEEERKNVLRGFVYRSHRA